MPTLLPWTSAEIGDLDIFAPAIPCLLVNTWYVDGEPDSTVSYFWQDEQTGIVHHELLLHAPVAYEDAMEWATAHAAGNDIERIHVRHARRAGASVPGRAKPRKGRAKTARRTRPRRAVAKRSTTGGRHHVRPGKRKAR